MASGRTEKDILEDDMTWYNELLGRYDHVAKRLKNIMHRSGSDLEYQANNPDPGFDRVAAESATVEAYRTLIRSMRETRRLVEVDFALSSALLKSSELRRGVESRDNTTEREKLLFGLDGENWILDEMICDLEQLKVRNESLSQYWIHQDFINRLESLLGQRGESPPGLPE